jgi:hypothetical protein
VLFAEQVKYVKLCASSDGTESLAAHSDDLAQLGPRPIIAGLTFGGKFEWYLVHQHNFFFL